MDKLLGIGVMIVVPLAILVAAIAVGLASRSRWPSVLGLIAALTAVVWVVRLAIRNRLWYQAPEWPIVLAVETVLLVTVIVALWRGLSPRVEPVSGSAVTRRHGTWTIVSLIAADVGYVVTLGVLGINPTA